MIVAPRIEAASSPDPVSYTHLDVYKRQVQIRPAAAAASSTLGGLGHVVAAIADRVGSYTPADQAVVARFLTDVLAITEQADDA